jgi:hypothetical protein
MMKLPGYPLLQVPAERPLQPRNRSRAATQVANACQFNGNRALTQFILFIETAARRAGEEVRLQCQLSLQESPKLR